MGKGIKRPHLLKYIWSFISEIHIESLSNDIHDHVYVSYFKGKYQLTAGNAVYSFEDKYENFYNIFNRINFQHKAIQNVLVLGTGLGSTIQMLEQNFGQNYSYTCVDIDEDILYFFSKYIQPELNSPIEQICTDAAIFIKMNGQKYDFIIVDLFIGCKVPKIFDTEYFLEDLQKNLTPNGLIIMNRVANNEASLNFSKQYEINIFKPFYPHGTSIHTGGNLMLINDKRFLKK